MVKIEFKLPRNFIDRWDPETRVLIESKASSSPPVFSAPFPEGMQIVIGELIIFDTPTFWRNRFIIKGIESRPIKDGLEVNWYRSVLLDFSKEPYPGFVLGMEDLEAVADLEFELDYRPMKKLLGW